MKMSNKVVMSYDDYSRHYKGTIEYDTVGAVCSHNEVIGISDEDGQGWCNNYRGFIQYRYLIENQWIMSENKN